MSTNVIRPGVATKQTPSGKNLVMLVAGVAVAIAVGFAFYTSQSQDVTVSGVEERVNRTVVDTWQINRQNAVNSANDQAAAYETARSRAMGESYAAYEAAQFEGVTDSWLLSFEASQAAAREAGLAAEQARLNGIAQVDENSISASVLIEESIREALLALQGQPSAAAIIEESIREALLALQGQPSAAAMIEESVQEALLAHQQAQQVQIEAQGEFFGVVDVFGISATVGPQAVQLLELEDHFMVAEIKGSQPSSKGNGHPLTVPEVEPKGDGHPLTDNR